MYQNFLKYSKLFRRLVCKYYGIRGVTRLTIPFPFYSDFSLNYLLYNEKGEVVKGFKSLREAIREQKRSNQRELGITVIYNKY